MARASNYGRYGSRTMKSQYGYGRESEVPRPEQEIPGRECSACKGTCVGHLITGSMPAWCSRCGGTGKEK